MSSYNIYAPPSAVTFWFSLDSKDSVDYYLQDDESQKVDDKRQVDPEKGEVALTTEHRPPDGQTNTHVGHWREGEEGEGE